MITKSQIKQYKTRGLNERMRDSYLSLHDKVANNARITEARPFILCETIYGTEEKDQRLAFTFGSKWGYIRLLFWEPTAENNLLVSTEIYSQGPNGEVRGKGRETFCNGVRILETIAGIVGTKITHVAVTHPISDSLPRERQYREVTSEELAKLNGNQQKFNFFTSNNLDKDGETLWIKTYSPKTKDPYPFSAEDEINITRTINECFPDTLYPQPYTQNT